MDLVAQVIQQGRDHGLPTYIKWREFCSLSPVRSFNDLKAFMDSKAVNTLQTVYL